MDGGYKVSHISFDGQVGPAGGDRNFSQYFILLCHRYVVDRISLKGCTSLRIYCTVDLAYRTMKQNCILRVLIMFYVWPSDPRFWATFDESNKIPDVTLSKHVTSLGH